MEEKTEEKAHDLMYILHEIKHGLGSIELYEEFRRYFPYFREVEWYNPDKHPSALRYLFDVVLKKDEME